LCISILQREAFVKSKSILLNTSSLYIVSPWTREILSTQKISSGANHAILFLEVCFTDLVLNHYGGYY
jgi:hypothetical protein